ncbi:hypothetical protein KAU09_05510 [Candidatus Parcubacteria bacterium]|nr:hypothetical protein [Candidatus Parcubacteria bacterium]
MKRVKFNKNIFLKVFICVFVFCSIFLCIQVDGALAQDAMIIGGEAYNQVDGQWIKIKAPATDKKVDKGTLKSIANWAKKWAKDEKKWLTEVGWRITWRTALNNFLKKLAYDTATYLATGDKGQAPMFQTDSLEDFLLNAADVGVGDMMETLGREGPIKFNLCNLSAGVLPKVGLGLYRSERPDKPRCTFSEAKKNWEETLDDPNFLNRFQEMFDPKQNDFGIALNLYSIKLEARESGLNIAKMLYPTEPEFKPKTTLISGKIMSPAATTLKIHDKALEEATKSETIYTDDPTAGVIGVFINTLLGKMIDQWAKKGLVNDFPDNSYQGDWGGFTDYEAGPYGEGVKGAKARFLTLTEPNFNVRGDYEILGELASCPNPQKAGPTNCVITDKFREAIAEKVSVGEAIEKGYLNPEGTFGFYSNGLEPEYNEGYPYRSMLILRKFRIIPVGWELAAQYIQSNPKETSGTKNLGDMAACYSDDPNDGYDGYYAEWCKGLVDPAWVLKAPLNYCRKEGPGSEIITENIMGQGKDSVLAISRNDNYCADEQSCIKENDDGSCELYGYCAEEKRKWDFNGESCDPMFNTCRTFKREGGQSVSYLENTLNYEGCSADNAGCKEYCRSYDYASNEYICIISAPLSGDKIYLDNDAEECDEAAEGCHEFIRAKKGLGANLFPNSSYEKEESGLTRTNDDAYDGKWSASSTGDDLKDMQLLIPDSAKDLNFDGMPITFSLYMKSCGSDVKIKAGIGQGGSVLDMSEKTINTFENWQRFEVSHLSLINVTCNQIFVSVEDQNAGCLIDAVQLELSKKATPYKGYQENNVIYEKIIPKYLENGCYQDAMSENYQLAADSPDECLSYARLCNADEVGCNLYTSFKDKMSIAGKTAADDYCPDECVGYDEYFQMQTAFDSLQPRYFVPSSAKKCGVAAVGCDEFTNLDELGSGAEAREYYSELRQCRKPDSSCAEFYTWEGSSETGYQLRVYQFEKDGLASDYGPKTIRNDAGECSKEIYNKPATDPDYNPDCREFYNKNGETTYHLYSRTISCSDNCHPYRRTENNIIENGAEAVSLCEEECNGDSDCESECAAIDCESQSNAKVCVFDSGEAAFCKNGGLWNHQHGRCLYDAVPGEGEKCSAGQAGCREYSGSSGSNMRFVLNDDIESGTNENWEGDLPTELNPSSEALMVGGHSLHVSGESSTISKILGSMLELDKSYYISFIAKSSGASKFDNIGFGPDNIDIKFELGGASDCGLSNEWKFYNFNLTSLNNDALDYSIGDEEKIIISANGAFYIDNIRLIEIVDRYYLIKNSWEAEACRYDVFGADQNKYYNLGCEAYQDIEGKIYNLRKFSKLCHDSAVGCELMIDTRNYSEFEGADLPLESLDISPKVNILKDKFVFAVYDQDKQCSSADKGCERLGEPRIYEDQVKYSDIFLKNDPDKYETILCGSDATQCEIWAKSEGVAYFKDPGDQVCEYKNPYGSIGGTDWYKKHVKKCDADNNGKINDPDNLEGNEEVENKVCQKSTDCKSKEGTCSSDSSCGINFECIDGKCYNPCILDKIEHECPTEFKTIGYGGQNNVIEQPSRDGDGNYWIGLCPASESGCTEYIDPMSRFGGNIIFNSDFSQDFDKNHIADGWSADENGEQEISLEPNTLYVLSIENNIATTTSITSIPTSLNFLILGSNNRFGDPVNKIIVEAGDGGKATKIFYVKNYVSGKIIVKDTSAGIGNESNESEVELKKAIVDYQIAEDLITNEYTVDFSKGLVLFNERKIIGANGYSKLNRDADLSPDDNGTWVNCDGSLNNYDCDSNILLKVNPDRVCAKWLACRSYVENENYNSGSYMQDQKNHVCTDIGLCDSVDENGSCNGFVVFTEDDKINQTYNTKIKLDQIGNMSGYAKAGYRGSFLETDYYPLGTMEQVGEVANVPNGGFEWAGSNGYPIGWSVADGESWDENKFNVINNPIEAQTEGIGYAPEGRNFLKLGSTYSATSEFIDVEPGIDYILTSYINTINLSEGKAAVKVEQFNNSGNFIAANDNIVMLNSGNKWTYKLGSFTTVANASRIKIILHSHNTVSAVGNFYFDDVKIRPALDSKDNLYTPQTCRLYPEDDSLSCNYYEDSGKKKKGWLGYCLEYDHYPGSEDACLLWWPVDKVKGEGVEEGAGYLGKMPVYYCAEAAGLQPLEYRERIDLFDLCLADSSGETCEFYAPIISGPTPPGYVIERGPNWIECGRRRGYYDCNWVPSGTMIKAVDGVNGWYISNGSFDTSKELENGIKYYDSLIGKLHDDLFAYCTKIVQTVNSVGSNKYWAGRVYEGSDHVVPGLGYEYNSDHPPFGAIVEPFPVNNPYEWDGDDQDGIQPLYVTKNGVRASHPYKISNISIGVLGICRNSKDVCLHINGVDYEKNKADCPAGDTCDIADFLGDPISKINRLFAQSYGTWQWDGSHYVQVAGDWTPPTTVCQFDTRDLSKADLIAAGYPMVGVCGGVGGCLDTGGYFAAGIFDCYDACQYVGYRDGYCGCIPPCEPINNCCYCGLDWCAFPPKVFNIMANSHGSNVTIGRNQFVNLIFNSKVDSQQLPLVMYAVDWGDNESTVVTGVEMRDRPNTDNPHSLHHLYSYWDLKAKHSVDQDDEETTEKDENTIYCGDAGAEVCNYDNPGNAMDYVNTDGFHCKGGGADPITCGDEACCAIQPSVKIKDNWGWCNNGCDTVGPTCPVSSSCPAGGYEPFGGWIVVNEK